MRALPDDGASRPATSGGSGSNANGAEDAHGLAELRHLLLSEERDRLAELERGLAKKEPRAEEVARVLVDAVRIEGARAGQLARVLAPTVEQALHDSVRRNPRALAEVLFPVIGPAIRRSVEAMLAAMMQRLNQTLDHSFSPRGLAWRLEAWRTHRPFAEVVLRESLLYRVEQVFLIRSASGLLAAHVRSPSLAAQDPDLVASMLSAISEFVRDSFTHTAGEELEHLEFAGQVLEIVRGPEFMLAALVRGTAPRSLRARLEGVLEEAHGEAARLAPVGAAAEALSAAVEPLLARCLESELREQRPRGTAAAIAAVIVLMLAVFLALRGFFAQRERVQTFETARLALESEAGFVLLRAERDGQRLRFEGLRDPLASDPSEVLRRRFVDPAQASFSFLPFESLDPRFVLARAEHALAPPPGVGLALEEKRLRASGRASHAWIERARSLAPLVGGVELLDETALVDSDREQLQAAAARLSAREVPFRPGSAQIEAGALEDLARQLAVLDERSRAAGCALELEVAAGAAHEELAVDPELAARRAAELRAFLARSAPGLFRLPAPDAPGREPNEAIDRPAGRILARIPVQRP